MQDEKKTKAQLLEDLTCLRQHNMALGRREAERTQELADTRAELAEALAQKAATSDILRLIATHQRTFSQSSTPLQTAWSRCLRRKTVVCFGSTAA